MTVELKDPQWTVFCSDKRFRVLVAGRRFGKTFLALTELCQAAWGPGRAAWYVAPTYKQAKGVAWKALKQLTRPYWAAPPRETELIIELAAGGSISLRGADNYDSLRGHGLDFLVMDEYASMDRAVWPEVLRPMLSDRQGRALFIGTPRAPSLRRFVSTRNAYKARSRGSPSSVGTLKVASLGSAFRKLIWLRGSTSRV